MVHIFIMAAVILLALACAQAVYCAPFGCGCGSFIEYPVVPECSGYSGYLGYPGCPEYGYADYGYPDYGYSGYHGYGYPSYPGYGYSGCCSYPALEESCCPGPVVEQKCVVQKPVTIPYHYTEPTCSTQCHHRGSVNREVFPHCYETPPVCETLEKVTKLPTTDIIETEQPLCKTTCTTSEYLITIPIVETTCTSAPLCKKCVRAQNHLLTTVSKKTACAKEVCTQNKIVEQPYCETVCQDYQGAITKCGAHTVLQPEVVKSCVQLPPYKCLKPASCNVCDGGYGFGGYGGVVGYDGYYGGYSGYPGYYGSNCGCGGTYFPGYAPGCGC